MTSRAPSRFGRLAPSLVFAAFIALAGCATGPSSPPAPISSGKPRVDPGPGQAGQDDRDRVSIHSNGIRIDEHGMPLPLAGEFSPDFLAGKALVRAGVLLPFSHPNSGVRAEAEGMLAGIEMALFDHAPETFVLLPKDTAGSRSQTGEMAGQARSEGADFFLGPLFGTGIAALNEDRSMAGLPIIGFSNDRDVAGGNTWLASISPEEEVASLVEYAVAQGYRQFAYFGPQSDLGQRIETALQREASRVGGRVAASGFYPESTQSPDSEARYIAKDEALDYVAGYCVINDLSEREFQLERGGQWVKGKSCDTFGPIGPWLVTRDEVPNPQDLGIWLEVDGVRHQDGNTRTMIFGIAEIVSYISQFMSLQPGDIISTGTPPGVGLGMKPKPVYLHAGQTIRLGIDGLGEQNQRTVSESGEAREPGKRNAI